MSGSNRGSAGLGMLSNTQHIRSSVGLTALVIQGGDGPVGLGLDLPVLASQVGSSTVGHGGNWPGTPLASRAGESLLWRRRAVNPPGAGVGLNKTGLVCFPLGALPMLQRGRSLLWHLRWPSTGL